MLIKYSIFHHSSLLVSGHALNACAMNDVAPLTGPQAKPWINALAPYQPGKAKAKDGRALKKLSANENPLGCAPAALAILRGEGDAAPSGDDAARYPDPDCTALRSALGAHHQLPPEQIICGTGSDELLNLAAQAYAAQGDEIIHVRYGFAVYDIATRRIGATPIVVPDAHYASDLNAILAAITPRTRLIYLANPNNPTGTMVSDADIAAFHAALPPHILLVLDQAYAEYLDDDGPQAFDLARTAHNVLITRTFSKIYGLAAQRIGYAFGAPALIDTLNRIRAPFNVTTTGQAAAIAALGDQHFVQQSRAHNSTWRDWLMREIGALGNGGLTAIASHANFLLVRFDGALTAEAALNGLADQGYMTRWLPGQGLPDCLRITIGDEADMRSVATILRQLVQQADQL
jgi:histidinol-phosphate aminotransferase